jgi:hypothetical protein
MAEDDRIYDALFYKIQQGADWNEQLQFFNRETNQPLSFVNCEAQLDIFPSAQNLTPILTLSSVAGTLLLNGAQGQLNWLVPASQTALFQPSPGLLSPVFGWDPLLRPFGFYLARVKRSNGQIYSELSGEVALRLGPSTLL